jgi:ubiquinol-cytochrome c reductase cytochrome b subunit
MISSSNTDSRQLKIAPRPSSADGDEGGSAGWRCWVWTTTGVVLMLLLVQFVTGLLVAFYYVPSADHAHTTVSFIEKALPSGSWLRALHHHGSQWLALFVFLHLLELFWRGAYRTRVKRWVAAVVLLGLVMAAGATGYSLPWDLRAFFSTRVAEGILNGLPLVGNGARAWLLGSNEISTLTISRFFALHVLVTPTLIFLVLAWQLFVLRSNRPCATADERSENKADNLGPQTGTPAAVIDTITKTSRSRAMAINQLTRNVLMAAVVFLLLGLYAHKFPAPLGPSASSAGVGYLPRPGAQFVWLYQTLKYVPGALGSLVGLVLPGLVLLMLAALPWLNLTPFRRISNRPRRNIGAVILSFSIVFIASMTVISYLSDRRDPRTRQQLALQAAEEAAFRREPFVPAFLKEGDTANEPGSAASPSPGVSATSPPVAYTKLCATCHGEHGQGARQGPLKFPPLLGVAEKPRRSVPDIIGILNDPTAYGLEPPMKSFATKLTDDEKREIAAWLVTLRRN